MSERLSAFFVVAMASLLSLALSAPAYAGNPTIDVNEFSDGADADLGDGVVDADLDEPGEQRTLRAAIQHANATPGADTITLPAGTYKLTIKGGEEDAGALGDLDITDDLTITGAAADTTIIKAKKAKDRIFDVHFDAVVTINDLTLLGGRADGGGGGGIRNFSDLTVNRCVITKCRPLSKTDDGGAIENCEGVLAVNDSYLLKNRSNDDAGAVDSDFGTTTFTNVTFDRNRAKDEGGAVENDGGTTSFINCTLSKNRAKNNGAAINNEEGGTINLTNCTLAFNIAKADQNIFSGPVAGEGGGEVVNMTNTILFGKKKKKVNCVGSITSGGGNLESGTDCGFSGSDQSGTDPRLDKKARDNGGFAPTHLLRDDSPAIDAGNDANCPGTDQAGNAYADVPNVGASVCDIGALEYIPDA